MAQVSVQSEDFDISAEIRALTSGDGDIGAVVSFTGLVRDTGGISQMELEHYPGMTQTALETIVKEAQSRWPLNAVKVIHRYGALAPQDQIVLVLTASRHRAAAFAAAEFIMDYLKTRAPFWKKETTREGAVWVDAREADSAAEMRWAQPRSPARS